MTNELSVFLELLYENGGWRQGWKDFTERNKAARAGADYLSSLPKSKLASIISNKYWNRYPSRKHYWNDKKPLPIGSKPLGKTLLQMVSLIHNGYPKLFQVFIQKAEGVLLLFTLNVSSGPERMRAAKRARKSTDPRLRNLVVGILPHSLIKQFAKDSVTSVRWKYITRMGIDNCYKEFMNDKHLYIRSLAMRHASLDEFDYVGFLESIAYLEKLDYKHWSERLLAEHIARLLPDDELAFHIDLANKSPVLREIFSGRLDEQ
jgi:hypothetical protein